MSKRRLKPGISWLLVIALTVMLLPVGQLPVNADDVNVALNKTVTVSSAAYIADGWGPKEGAVDGDYYSTAWLPEAEDQLSPWLMVDLGKKYTISSYKLMSPFFPGNAVDGPTSTCRDFRLQKSDEGVNFTDIDTVTNNYDDTSIYSKTFDIPQTAQYFRVMITGADARITIQELELFGEADAGGDPIYTVTYDGNGNTGGSVPVDNGSYGEGDTITVLGNTGNLTRTGYTFAGWNTDAEGDGEAYEAGDELTMEDHNVILYAQWAEDTGGDGDTAPPVITDSVIQTSDEGRASLRIRYEEATDDTDDPSDLMYTAYYSKSSAMDTVEDIEENGTKVNDRVKRISAEISFNGELAEDFLVDYEADTQFYYNVIVEDAAGNKSCYSKGAYTTWPKPVLGALELTELSSTSMKLGFTPATDAHQAPDKINYMGVASKENVFNSVSDMNTAYEEGKVIRQKQKTAGEDSFTFTGLEENTKYYFSIYFRTVDHYAGLYPALSNSPVPAKVELTGSEYCYINANQDEPLLIPYNISFNSPFDSTFKLTEFKTTISFNNTSLKPDVVLKNNVTTNKDLLQGAAVTVSNLVVNGTTTSFDVAYADSTGIDAANGRLFDLRLYKSKDAVAGDTFVYITDTTMTLSKDGNEYHLGTGLDKIEETPGKLTLRRSATYNLSLAKADVDYVYGGDSVGDKTRITTKGNVINAAKGTEIIVPVVSLAGNQADLGAIEATFKFYSSSDILTFKGIVDGGDFIAEALRDDLGQTGEIRVYLDPEKDPVGDYTTPFQFKFKFALNKKPVNNTIAYVWPTSFKVFPLANGTISDSVYRDIKIGDYIQDINFHIYGEILTNIISNSAAGDKITSIVKDGTTTIYCVKTVTEPLDPVTYEYQWLTNKDGNNYTTPIAGATGSSFAVTDDYVGYRLKAMVTMRLSNNDYLHSLTSDSVLVEAKDAPAVTMGSLLHPDGYKIGKSIGYNPSITYNYENSTKTTTYQWSYSDTEDGAYSDINGATEKNLLINANYINKWLKFTVTAREEIGDAVKTTTVAAKYLLGGANVPKPAIDSVNIAHSDGAAIADSARARDKGTIKAEVAVTDAAQILTEYSYQWLRNGAAIEDATNESYSLQKADVGSDISVQVSALSDYYAKNDSSQMTSAAVEAYANLNNSPVITAGAVSVTNNKYVVGNVITVPFTFSKYYDAPGNDSNVTRLAYSAQSGADQSAAATGIDMATGLNLTDESFTYTIASGDMNKRYIVFKLMARERTIDEDIAVGNLVVAVDTYTGLAITWAYTLYYEVSDNDNFGGYKAYAINANIGGANTLNIAVNNDVVRDALAAIFYAPECGRYMTLMPGAVTPDIGKFTFNTGSTGVIYFGKQDNTDTALNAVDMIKPINVWLKKDVNNSAQNMLISEVSGNGVQDAIDATQIMQAILKGSPDGPDKKAGSFGILSK